MNNYDHDQDYAVPYHRSMSVDGFAGRGADYGQYANDALEIIGRLPRRGVLQVGGKDGWIPGDIAARFSESAVNAIDVSARAFPETGRHAGRLIVHAIKPSAP